MKKIIKIFGTFILALTFCFIIVACPNGDGNGITLNTPESPRPFNDITAAQLVNNIRIGWNLGNTFEAAHMSWLPPNPTVTQMETGWGNPVTTKANITAIKNAGFNTIRIPVSWTKAAGPAPNYAIRTDWLARVVDVVNYAVDNGMYIILNTHHDEEDVFTFMNSNAAAGQAAFKKIWEQIADTFKNYDEKLIFEALNEPRTVGSTHEWSGGTPEERTNLNAYYPIFINAVRNSGGNNGKRIVMINTYAARYEAVAVDALVIPTDTIANKIIVTIHSYEPFSFTYPSPTGDSSVVTWSSSNSADTAPIHNTFQPAYDKFVSKGIPVIVGEFGTSNKDNTVARAAYAEYYVTYAKSKGFKCIVFDNGVREQVPPHGTNELFAIFNRANNTFFYPEILTALLKGADSSDPDLSGDVTYNLGTTYTWTHENSVRGWELTPEIRAKIADGSIKYFVIGLNAASISTAGGLGGIGMIFNASNFSYSQHDKAFPWFHAEGKTEYNSARNGWIPYADLIGTYGAGVVDGVVYLQYDLTQHPNYNAFKTAMSSGTWAQFGLYVHEAWDGGKTWHPVSTAFFKE